MKHAFIGLAAAGIALVLGPQGPGTQNATAADGYRLLRLGGTWVKWGEPVLGSRAMVTYAFAERRHDNPAARNCRSMVPFAPLLRRQGIAPAAFRGEVEAAFAAWSKVADISFAAVDDPASADIVLGVQRIPRGRAYTNVSYGAEMRDGTRMISRSLICLNPRVGWKIGFDGNLDRYDLRYTLIHEIGHAIGLDHPGPEGQVMSYKYHEDFRQLRPGDMIGASLLYGGAGANRPAEMQQAASQGREKAEAEPQLSLGEKPRGK